MKRLAVLAAAAMAAMMFLMTASLCCAQGPQGPEGPMGHRGFGMEGRGGPGGPARLLPPGTWWRDQQVVTAIGLSADQQKRIDDIFLNARVELIHMHATLEENDVRLDDVLHSPTFDAAAAQKLIDQGADDRAALEKADAHMLLNIRAVLTADQWTKLEAQRRSRFDRNPEAGPGHFRDRMHNNFGPGAPPAPGAGQTPPPAPPQ